MKSNTNIINNKPCGNPCNIFKVKLRCSSFWGITKIAYKQPRLEIFAKTFPIGTSSFGNNKSTIKPKVFNRCSIYSAYSLQKKQSNLILTKIICTHVSDFETTIISQSFRSGLSITGGMYSGT